MNVIQVHKRIASPWHWLKGAVCNSTCQTDIWHLGGKRQPTYCVVAEDHNRMSLVVPDVHITLKEAPAALRIMLQQIRVLLAKKEYSAPIRKVPKKTVNTEVTTIKLHSNYMK